MVVKVKKEKVVKTECCAAAGVKCVKKIKKEVSTEAKSDGGKLPGSKTPVRKRPAGGNTPDAKKGKFSGGKKFTPNKKFTKKPGVGGGAATGTNAALPKETAKSRRDRKLARKQKKPKFELTQQCKKIWEKLRSEKNNMSKKENHQLVDDLLKLVKQKDNKLMDLVLAHDTSRIIQTCLKEGNEAQRTQIFGELKEKVVQLSKDKYAKNILWKMIKYGTTEQRGHIIANFKGNVYGLIRKNKLSASVIEYAYNNFANKDQRHMLIRELCGKVYQLHPDSESKTFGVLLSEMDASSEERKSLLTSFHQALLPLVEKQVMTLTLVHKVFYEYFMYCDDSVLRSEMIEAIRESLIHMIHTHDGAHVSMRCLWYGSKKDRKVILKTMKEFVIKLSTEEFGHLALLAAFDCVDDTVFIKKAIITPMMKQLNEIIASNYGMKVMIYLMSPRDTSHFLPETIKLLTTGDNNPTSKKEMKVRHAELVQAAVGVLVEHLTDNVEDFVFDKSRFLLMETAMLKVSGDIIQPLVDAVVQLATPPFEAGQKNDDDRFHIAEHPSGHLLMKKIISGESKKAEADSSSCPLFSRALLNGVGGAKLATWGACNRGASILLALVESKSEELAGESRQMLQPYLNKFKKFAAAEVKLAKILATKLE